MYDGDRKLEKQTVDIETAGATVAVSMQGATVLSLSVRGDAATDYELDARLDGSDEWTQNITAGYSGTAVDAVETLGWPEVRVRVSSGTGTAGNQAEIKLAAGGG